MSLNVLVPAACIPDVLNGYTGRVVVRTAAGGMSSLVVDYGTQVDDMGRSILNASDEVYMNLSDDVTRDHVLRCWARALGLPNTVGGYVWCWLRDVEDGFNAWILGAYEQTGPGELPLVTFVRGSMLLAGEGDDPPAVTLALAIRQWAEKGLGFSMSAKVVTPEPAETPETPAEPTNVLAFPQPHPGDEW